MDFFKNRNYLNLPDINEANYFVPKQDFPCFQDVAKVLHKHKSLDKYVITLLHTHFDINEDEILVEFKEDKDTIIKTPIKSGDIKNYSIKASSWRLTKHQHSRFLPLEYTTLLADDNKYCICKEDEKAFEDVAKVLLNYGNINRFGLAYAYQDIELESNETTLEKTYVEDRELVIQRTLTNSIKKNDVQTSWKLKEDIIYAMASCSTEYETYCSRYCEETSNCRWADFNPETEDSRHESFNTRHRGTIHEEKKNSIHRRR